MLSLMLIFSFIIAFSQSDRQKESLIREISQQKKKLQERSSDTKALSKIAMSYYKLSDMQSALAYYDRLIVLNPKASGAYANRGVCRLLSGNKLGACSDFIQSVVNGEDPKIIENKRLSEYVAVECKK